MVRQATSTAAPGLAQPDWAAPWYRPWAATGREVWQAATASNVGVGAVAAALNAHAPPAVPVRFVSAAEVPADVAYEAFIARQRAVPTRDNGHDAFNGLAWLRFARTKARLNALQAAEIARDGVRATRGPVRDAATVFDENAVLLHAPDALWQALVARRWRELFGPLRPLWREARVLVFGHAALEKLVTPYKSITGHAWRVEPAFDPGGDLLALDEMNPRAIRYQLDGLAQQVRLLPGEDDPGRMSDLGRALLRLHTDLVTERPEDLTTEALWSLRSRIAALSDHLTEAYLR